MAINQKTTHDENDDADGVSSVNGAFVAAIKTSYDELKIGNDVAALEAHGFRDGDDPITLSAGSAVPADCDLCEGNPVQIDQAALTGESFPVTVTTATTPRWTPRS
ncbi:hypothetical protein PHYSODRAFT_249668 [Phytophthora sojae]|uniref:P-type ATPase A domain-containing protein n=1 Tax=Phytophthora sojae (strain P6497) TaxID=1094619 RepID=G4Z6F1_PHYSP|nr:hypothetical protein PHYSODRAFT_249668 [Phytophthora sojae]EGZ22399.1 hypothetical protein PHYSODRAFT_249668 [Phytophthora sojae]|eukprot:XP_009525116.1 hypothetical protein PHYSODRAFT_249668 [Phytophthora sojae]